MTRDEQAERYRTAAEETLRQVDWCVQYLHRIRKRELAEAVDKNRRFIQDRLSEDRPLSARRPRAR